MKCIQFELWQECNMRCTFCYLHEQNLKTPDAVKLDSIRAAHERVKALRETQDYDTVGFIGGEFFQGQLRNSEVKAAFFELMDEVISLLKDGVINNVWIAVTLGIGKQDDLYELLERFGSERSKLWLTTSWDSMGRFHTEKMRLTWEGHLKRIRALYPEVHINTTVILTGDFIDKYLAGEISIKAMEQTLGTQFFFKQPVSGDAYANWEPTLEFNNFIKREVNSRIPNFFPTRSQFIRFLTVFREREDRINWDKICNIQYRADDFYRHFNNNKSKHIHRAKGTVGEIADDIKLPCGHPIYYDAYVDQTGCCLCDKKMVEEAFL